MLTREQYLAYAKRNEIPMELLFDYYNKFNRRPELTPSLEVFSELFTQYLANFAVSLEAVRAYYNRIFTITTAYDKNGNFITIY